MLRQEADPREGDDELVQTGPTPASGRFLPALMYFSMLVYLYMKRTSTDVFFLAMFLGLVFLASLHLVRWLLHRYRRPELALPTTQDRHGRRRRNRHRVPQLFSGIDPAILRLSMMDRDFNANDYEMLLALDENNAATSTKGLTQHQINTMPSFTLSTRDIQRERESDGKPADSSVNIAHSVHSTDAKDSESNASSPSIAPATSTRSCSICLEPFVAGDKLRALPCLHRFHVTCIDTWLLMQASCPVCKWEM